MFQEPTIANSLLQEEHSPHVVDEQQTRGSNTPRNTATSPEHHPVGLKHTTRVVLLAEDSDDMRAVVAMHLRRAGCLVVECRNGSELVRALADYLDDVPQELMHAQYDLLISDIRMPGISGLSVAEAATDCAKFPPTILITAFGDEETHEKALNSGVVAVFDKPFDMSDLLQTVREVFTKIDDPASAEESYPESEGN